MSSEKSEDVNSDLDTTFSQLVQVYDFFKMNPGTFLSLPASSPRVCRLVVAIKRVFFLLETRVKIPKAN